MSERPNVRGYLEVDEFGQEERVCIDTEVFVHD